MSKRPLVVVSAFVLLASACAKQPPAKMTLGAGKRFVPQVVDSVTDVGRSPSITLGADGNPVIAYLGFNSIAKPGEIPESRPVTLPPVPGVMTAGLSDGRWTLADVEAPDDKLTTEDDKGATVPLAADSASSVLDSEGNLQVVWIDSEGLKHATGSGSQFSVDTIATGKKMRGPSIAVDAAGNPWVSYFNRDLVMMASKNGERWDSTVVAKASDCGTNCAISRTAAAFVKGGPVVAFVDGGNPRLWSWNGDSPIIEPLPGSGGYGMSLAAGNSLVASYVSESGDVTVATQQGASWSSQTAGTVTIDPVGWMTTGIAVDDNGVNYVTWWDQKANVARLATGESGKYQTLPTPGTEGGASPSIAVSADGSEVWLAWYDHENGNLQAGSYGLQDVVLAEASPLPQLSLPAKPPTGAPSPASSGPTVSAGPSTSTAPIEPAGGKTVTLKLMAPAGAVGSGFDKTKLSAPAGTAIDLVFDNQDPGVPHNVEIWTADPLKDPTATAIFVPEGGATITGPDKVTYSVPPMDAGTYFYRCLVHPTTMTGALTVK